MRSYWLNYDLNNPDSYEKMYRWLAGVEAKECGQSSVFLKFDGSLTELKTAIKAAVPEIESDKVYVIYKKDSGSEGAFLFGNRNLKNPWDIYATETEEVKDS